MDKIKFHRKHPNAILPTRGSVGAAGLDLYSLGESEFIHGHPIVLRTGVAVEIPPGHYGRIAPRSSLASSGIDVLGGVIDSDYRGEIFVVLVRHTVAVHALSTKINVGDRVAQLIIEKIEMPEPVWGDLEETERGEGGFGSTGA